MGAFLSIRCSIPSKQEEELPALLFEMPILGTEINSADGDRVMVTVYLPHSAGEMATEAKTLIQGVGGRDFEIASVAEEDWMEAYRKTVQPFEVGETWWIDPHPGTPTPAPPDRKRLVVPPRMAFGSGSHESTRLILSALETIDVCGWSVLDVGAGSGILALACDLLGAGRVLAVDIDPVAADVARQIRGLQEWHPEVHYVIGSADCAARGGFDLVLCNMISAHSIPLLDAMSEALAPGGTLLLSGLLSDEAHPMVEELAYRGLVTASINAVEEWVSLEAGRPR